MKSKTNMTMLPKVSHTIEKSPHNLSHSHGAQTFLTLFYSNILSFWTKFCTLLIKNTMGTILFNWIHWEDYDMTCSWPQPPTLFPRGWARPVFAPLPGAATRHPAHDTATPLPEAPSVVAHRGKKPLSATARSNPCASCRSLAALLAAHDTIEAPSIVAPTPAIVLPCFAPPLVTVLPCSDLPGCRTTAGEDDHADEGEARRSTCWVPCCNIFYLYLQHLLSPVSTVTQPLLNTWTLDVDGFQAKC